MQKYKVTDVTSDEYIIKDATGYEVTKLIGTTNVKYMASRNLLYQKKYKIEFDGMEEPQEFLTVQKAYDLCRKFKVGMMVTIIETKTNNKHETKIIKKPARVLGRYPSFLVLGVGTDFKTKESFTYIEIVTQALLKVKKEKKDVS